KMDRALSQDIDSESIEPIIVKEIHIPVYGRNSIPIKALNFNGPNLGTNHSFIRIELKLLLSFIF
ncbi:MAG TPA: hypothetical protein VJU85_04480, partial [Nitrososphaeraceae archaeon]|nr:hypothetical protein [Nitrososphaeraceae archaeon]